MKPDHSFCPDIIWDLDTGEKLIDCHLCPACRECLPGTAPSYELAGL